MSLANTRATVLIKSEFSFDSKKPCKQCINASMRKISIFSCCSIGVCHIQIGTIVDQVRDRDAVCVYIASDSMAQNISSLLRFYELE